MKDETVLIKNSDIIFREEFDDFAVLFHPDTGEGYGLNSVGVSIWKSINGKNTVHDIIRIISRKYQNVSVDIESEIRAFTAELIDCGLIGYAVTN